MEYGDGQGISPAMSRRTCDESSGARAEARRGLLHSLGNCKSSNERQRQATAGIEIRRPCKARMKGFAFGRFVLNAECFPGASDEAKGHANDSSAIRGLRRERSW
jgi:hypothetical protein